MSLTTADPFALEPEPGRALAWRAGARLVHRSNIFWVFGSLVLLVGGHGLLEGVPGLAKTLSVRALARIGVGLSRLGTSEATAIGACAFALRKLDQGKVT